MEEIVAIIPVLVVFCFLFGVALSKPADTKEEAPPNRNSSKNNNDNNNNTSNTSNSNTGNGNTTSGNFLEKPIDFKCVVCKGHSKIRVKENKYDAFVCEACKSVYTYGWLDSKLQITLVKKYKSIPPDIKQILDFFQYTKEIEDTIDMEVIKSKYRELLSLYHPDKVSTLGDELKELAERKTKEIVSKYNRLSDWHQGWA